jgi:hypothetical protein
MKKFWLCISGLLLVAIVCGVYFLIKNINSEDSIVIINGDNVTIRGKISFQLNDMGKMEPVVIEEGRLVLYRSGDTLPNLRIRPGECFRWDKNLNLYKVGTFDTSKTNDELAKFYGIKSKNR